MFRKPTKKRAPVQVRQRQDDDLSGEDETDIVKDVKRRKRANPFQQSTMKVKGDQNKVSSSSDSDDSANAVVAEDAFAASGSAAPLGPRDQGATATHDIDTDINADAQAQFERVQQQLKEGLIKDGKVLYKGQAMYGAKEAKDTAKGNASSGLNRIGPIRAPQFVRQTVRWDYAPDICKDYKETGFCTFGDSCKFLHDRSDYKHGWEIERDYESGRLNQIDETNYEINDNEDEFPEECYICGKPFVSPVVTRCKHYFCEACALAAFRKSKRCQICNQNTGGVFNIAKDLIAKLNGTAKSKKEPKSESDESDSDHEHHHTGEHACCSKSMKEEAPAEEEQEHEKHDGGAEMKQENMEEEEYEEEDHEEEGQEEPVHNEVQESVEIKMEEIEDNEEDCEDEDERGGDGIESGSENEIKSESEGEG